MKKFANVLWGLVFIIIGVIFGLNALDITDINIFFDGWWTLFIIVPSFIGIFTDNDKTGNLIGLLIGVALLLCCQDLLDFALIWKLSIPTILVIIGLSLIFKDAINAKVKKEIKKINKNKNKNNPHEYCATFGGQKLNFCNEKFEGCDLTAVFGGVNCNLKGSKITEDVVINASAIFGGIDIIVPEDVNVKVTSTPIFGGVSNKVSNVNKEDNKTIYINATCIFGGVDLK